MYKVIIFGTGISSKHVVGSLNKDCKVIAYVDNDYRKRCKISKIPVVSPNEIINFKYDYIIIASQYNDEIFKQLIELNISKSKILQFYKFIDYEFNYVEKAMNTLLSSDVIYEVIATGISYCNLGLRVDYIKKPCIKFTFGSQDLYYDYNLIKYIVDNYKYKIRKVKHIIIGLSYYSFQYDLSLSAMKNKTILYYDVIGLYHNNHKIIEMKDDYNINKNIANKVFVKDDQGKYKFNWYKNLNTGIKDKKILGEVQAKRDCNKNYPNTVEENKKIFAEYLELLKENNIKPIVVVFPASKYYTKYFSKRIENEYNEIIKEFQEKYNFQYLDYFRSELFDDDDFFDVSHLNKKGAEKFTNILNEVIEW